MEEEVLDHWSHHHPLTLFQTSSSEDCYGCRVRISRGEQAYRCSKKCAKKLLFHEACAEMPRKIRHPMHPQHTLIQVIYDIRKSSLFYNAQLPDAACTICENQIWRPSMRYKCRSSGCEFDIHMKCAQDRGVMDADDAAINNHPSHPQHQLVRVSRRSCSLRCDACGTTHKGIFYACFECQYWIHHRCAILPHTIQSKDHLHSLSLSFFTPLQYIKSHCKCDVCHKYLLEPKYWIYHCELCRYVAHIKCAPVNPTHLTLPINDVVENQIKPFVKRGQQDGDQILLNVKDKFQCNWHKHELSLISSSSSEEQEKDSDDEECGEKSELICDGCISPIFQKKHTSPSSSSTSDKYEYMSCSECKYFLHIACFQLPPRFPSLPLHHEDGHDHRLILRSCGKLEFRKRCSVCGLYTNGLYYACTGCRFIADIKCASLLDPVYHLAHPQHLLNHLSLKDMQEERSFIESITGVIIPRNYSKRLCDAGCGETASTSDCYVCGSCDFVVHVRCASIPASVTDRRWDDHLLLLTYGANENDHPAAFYCDQCERKMNPKNWMYHCRHCDSSFHPHCFPTISGKYRNIKFGQKYVIATAHPHPLTYHFLTIKRRCDSCHLDKQGERGFQCASCYFFICLNECGEKMLEQGHIQTAD